MYQACQNSVRGSEWLLFNAKRAIVQLYHYENKLLFDNMMTASMVRG